MKHTKCKSKYNISNGLHFFVDGKCIYCQKDYTQTKKVSNPVKKWTKINQRQAEARFFRGVYWFLKNGKRISL